MSTRKTENQATEFICFRSSKEYHTLKRSFQNVLILCPVCENASRPKFLVFYPQCCFQLLLFFLTYKIVIDIVINNFILTISKDNH